MPILQYIVPFTIVCYFLFRIKGSLVYALGLPLVYCFGEAMFIPIYGFTFRIPQVPFPLSSQDLLAFLLFIVWFYVRQKRPNCKRLSLRLDIVAMGLFLALLLLQFPVSMISLRAGKIGAVISCRYYFYLPLSFMVWMDVLRRFTKDEILALIRAISLLTVLLMVLYVLSAVGFAIYPQEAHRTDYIGSAVVVRNFVTMPYWISLAIAYYLVQLIRRGKVYIGTIVALGVLCIGVLFSITRSYIFLMGFMLGIVILYTQVRIGGFHRLRIPVMLVGFSIAVIVLVNVYAPANMSVLMGRVQRLENKSISESTLGSRFQMFKNLSGFIRNVDPVFGIGFTRENLDNTSIPWFRAGDMMWAQILLWFGWSAVIVLSVVLMTVLWDSFKLAVSRDTSQSHMGLLLFMVMVWDVGTSFISWSYLYYTAAATFPLALVAVEKRKLWAVNPVTKPEISFFSNVSFNWFFRHGQYGFLRRLTFAFLIVYFAFKVGSFIAR